MVQQQALRDFAQAMTVFFDSGNPAGRPSWRKAKPAFTSQRCSACGHVDAKSRESQARFACTACGIADHADVNAARNIAAGHAVTARGGDGAARPANREPHLLAS
jgi:putative transposase